jgi:hypothetical protein
MESASSREVRSYWECLEYARRMQKLLYGRVQGRAEDAQWSMVRTRQCLAASMHDTMIGPHTYMFVSTSRCLPITPSAAADGHEA